MDPARHRPHPRHLGRARSYRSLSPALAALPLCMALASALCAQEARTPQTAEPDTVPEPAGTVQARLDSAFEEVARLDALVDSIVEIDVRSRGAGPEVRQLARVQADGAIRELKSTQTELLNLIPELESAGAPVDSLRDRLGALVHRVGGLYEEAIARRVEQLEELRDERTETPPDSLDELEARVRATKAVLDTLLLERMSTLARADSLGLDTSADWERVDRFLLSWVESQVGRLQIALENRSRLKDQIEDAERANADPAELGALRTQHRAADERIRGITTTLSATADLLAQRGYETAGYRQIVIRATGDVTADILDPKVFLGLMKDIGRGFWAWTRENGPTLFVKLLIVIGITVLFRIGLRLMWWILRATGLVRYSKLMMDLATRMLRPIATITGLATGLWLVGVNPTTLLAGLGIAGVIIGLALQDSMSNLAAGLFILATRPFDVEDIVEAGGVVGTVQEMGLANTTILTFDRRRLFVPNRQIWSNVIENRSSEPIRRVEVTAKISYREDLDRALDILGDVVDVNEMVLEEPEPVIFVKSLADSWIEIAVWPWTKSENWLALTRQLPRLIKLRLEKEGIEVPYPRTELVVSRPPKHRAAVPSSSLVDPPDRGHSVTP